MPKKKPAVTLAVGIGASKAKPNTFQPPKGWSSDNDDEVKEALLKFKEMPDGTCEMVSLDGAPFKANGGDMEEEPETLPEKTDDEEEMPADMPMEDAITALQKRDQRRY